LLLAALAIALIAGVSLGLDAYRDAADEYGRAAHAQANSVTTTQTRERVSTSIIMLRTPP